MVLVALGLIALVAGRADAVDGDGATHVREMIDLGGTWQATLDTENKGEREGWFKEDFAAQGWRQVQVPGSFANVAPEIDRYEGVGWFRRSFRMPQPPEGRRVVLHFEGVNYQCKVWVNGRLVGENPDAFLGFDLPVGPEARFDRENVIVVRVDNTRRRDIIPGGRQGWHPFGGILREVQVQASGLCRIESARIVAEPNGTGGFLRLQTVVANGCEQRIAGRTEVDHSRRERGGRRTDRRPIRSASTRESQRPSKSADKSGVFAHGRPRSRRCTRPTSG